MTTSILQRARPGSARTCRWCDWCSAAPRYISTPSSQPPPRSPPGPPPLAHGCSWSQLRTPCARPPRAASTSSGLSYSVFCISGLSHKKLTFSSRYLTLTPEEFRRGPMVSGLLTEDEADSILFTLLRPDTALPDHLAPLRRTMSQPRHRLEVRTAD